MNPFPKVPLVLLQRGRGWIGRLIRWQTRSPYSHAAIWDPDIGLLEAREFRGVRICPDQEVPWEELEGYTVTGATADEWAQVSRFLSLRLGYPYDYLAVARFVSRKTDARDERWFCSELVYQAFLAAGMPLLRTPDAWRVSPGLLGLSPLLCPYEPRSQP